MLFCSALRVWIEIIRSPLASHLDIGRRENMRTQVLQEFAIGTPWLEHDPRSRPIEKTYLQSFPFTIGRNDLADMHIDSHQVSREHAVITRQGKKYRVQDLGSTNGTFLNGERIEEATLSDGDLLMIAEVEFVFFCDGAGAARQTVTQVMQPAPYRSSRQGAVWNAILAVRQAHEVITHGCLRTLFQPVVELASGEAFGYEAFAASGAGDVGQPRCEQLAAGVECRATDRVRQLFRRIAVEQSSGLPHGGRLLLAITAAESSGPSLVDHLHHLSDLVGESRQIVVEIPDNAVHGTADFYALLANLRDARIQVAYDGYASGKAQITERKDVVPDFLKLAPSMFRSIHRGIDRQRQVQMIVRASHDIGCDVIATGIDSEADLKVCRELGCTLAQGDLFGHPQSLSSLIDASRSRAQVREPAR